MEIAAQDGVLLSKAIQGLSARVRIKTCFLMPMGEGGTWREEKGLKYVWPIIAVPVSTKGDQT